MCQQVFMKRHCISFDAKAYRILIVIPVIVITRYILRFTQNYVSIDVFQ